MGAPMNYLSKFVRALKTRLLCASLPCSFRSKTSSVLVTSHYWHKMSEILFWFVILKVWVHSQSIPLALGLVRQYSWWDVAKCSLHGQYVKKRLGFRYVFQVPPSNDWKTSHYPPHFKVSITNQKRHTREQAFNMWPSGDIPAQTRASALQISKPYRQTHKIQSSPCSREAERQTRNQMFWTLNKNIL